MAIGDIIVGFSRALSFVRSTILVDTEPSLVVGSGGGKGAVTLIDAAPIDAIGAGGGKKALTLIDDNPSVAIT